MPVTGPGTRTLLFLAATAIAIALPSQVASASASPQSRAAGDSASVSSAAAVDIETADVETADVAATLPTHGIDVSWPQCGNIAGLPADRAFAVVGVNKGLANTTNPCLADELAWAEGSSGSATQPTVALYVNIGNPALDATWWPASNTTQSGVAIANPYGACKHLAGAACAYVYGYSMALDDVQTRLASVDAGAASSYRWWLDVETSNTWQTDTRANAASITGMAKYLTSIGANVGIYSTAHQWKEIAGTTKSTSALAKLPSWLAGASSRATAAKQCARAGLTPGSRVSLVQWVSSTDLDYNYSCSSFTTTPKPKISGTVKVGKKLTAIPGSWAPKYTTASYVWKANGATISKATKRTYTVTKKMAGKRLTVVVTAAKNGYTTVVETSSATAKVKK